MRPVKLAVITGSGTHSLPGFVGALRESETPFGSVILGEGRLAGAEVLHLSRHGESHQRLSNHVNHRANVVALRESGAEAVLAVTVCGAVDPEAEPGTLIVFDDLHFLANRLADGSLCTLHVQPGATGRGHWIFDRPFSDPLRQALLQAAQAQQRPARDGGCYGHVDGPRFNTRAEIRMLAGCGVTAVSQTAGPEAVLCGEAELPYALLGFVTDYANGVHVEPTPVAELVRLMAASTEAFASILADAVARVATTTVPATGTNFRFA